MTDDTGQINGGFNTGVTTTDHGNANPGLTFYGQGAFDRFDRVAHARHSTEWIFENLRPAGPGTIEAQLRDLTFQATGIDLSAVELGMLAASSENKRVAPFAAANAPIHVLGAILADSLGVASSTNMMPPSAKNFRRPPISADVRGATAASPLQ